MSDAIRVITTCTSQKHGVVADPALVVLPGFASERQQLPAERLYTGEQHLRLMAGVDQLEAVRPVDVWVISAQAGIISGKREMAPYDESFAGMSADAIRAVADQLEIPSDFRKLVGAPAELTIVLVGNDYFDAASLDDPVPWSSPTLLFASASRVARLPPHANLKPVIVDQALAKRWSLPLTLLKGELASRLLSAVAAAAITPSELFTNDNARRELLIPTAPALAC